MSSSQYYVGDLVFLLEDILEEGVVEGSIGIVDSVSGFSRRVRVKFTIAELETGTFEYKILEFSTTDRLIAKLMEIE